MCSCKRHGDQYATCTCSPHPAPTAPPPDDAARAYTPTTEEVRRRYSLVDVTPVYRGDLTRKPAAKYRKMFDRWLTAHDAEVRADERAQIAARRDEVAEAVKSAIDDAYTFEGDLDPHQVDGLVTTAVFAVLGVDRG